MNYNIIICIIFLSGLITLIVGISFQNQPAIITGTVILLLDSIGFLMNIFPRPITSTQIKIVSTRVQEEV